MLYFTPIISHSSFVTNGQQGSVSYTSTPHQSLHFTILVWTDFCLSDTEQLLKVNSKRCYSLLIFVKVRIPYIVAGFRLSAGRNISLK